MNSESNILRNIIFPNENICPKTELYYRAVSGSISENKLNIRGTAVFDTYFNSFPIGKYLEYCTFSGLYLKLKVCGIFILRIFGVNKNQETLVIEKNISAKNIIEDITDISNCIEKDFSQIYFSLESENGILDGYDFELEIKYKDGKEVKAHGYEEYPDNYSEAHKSLEKYFASFE